MIALPRQLAPWATQLALFPEDIALSIGPMVSRLAALVGGWPADNAPQGTPNGHDGIARRGLYDRLLATEWALLEELPDEFLRRAVSGEHLFLQQAYQDLAAARQSVVLFDVGPDQLGAPRLAHLAILIVLAQRAAAHDATLQWGTLQDRERRLADGVTKSNVRDLCQARCEERFAGADVRIWMEGTALRSASEIWFVGSEGIAAVAREQGASALIVSEILDPSASPRIRVTAAAARQSGLREAILDVPPAPAAVRMLRDPFDTQVAPRQTTPWAIAPDSNILFSADGRRLYVRSRGGDLITIQIPNSPRAKVGPPARFVAPMGHKIIAVGQSGSSRRAMVLTQYQNDLTVYLLSKKGRTANRIWRYATLHYQLPAPADEMPLRPLGYLGARLCYIDHAGNLVELHDGKFWLLETPAAAASRITADAFVYVKIRTGTEMMIARADHSAGIATSSMNVPLRRMDGARYFFGAYGLGKFVAWGADGSPCVVTRGTEQVEIAVPRGCTVIGMVERGPGRDEPFVVAIDASRTQIDAFGRSERETLLTVPGGISFAAASDAEAVIGYITHAGELGVYSCRHSATLVQIAGDRP